MNKTSRAPWIRLLPATWLVPLVLAGSVACSTTRFAVTRVAPAEINVPAGKRIAIASIGGQEPEPVVAELVQALVSTKRFEVLDRQHVREVLKEQDLGASGHVSDDSAVSIGQMTGAAALIVGDVLASEYKEDISSTKQQCSRDGKLVDCVSNTRTAVADVRVSLKVVETETGKVLAAKSLQAQKQRSTQAFDAEPAPINARTELLSECRRDVITDFIKVIAPHDISVTVALREDSDLPELEVGNNYAKIGNWSEAVGQYQSALARAGSNPEIANDVKAMAHFNLGVGLGYSGRYDDGIREIERAYALDPDDLYREEIAVIRRFKDDAAKLAEQQASGGGS